LQGRIIDLVKIEATNFLRTTFLVLDEVCYFFKIFFLDWVSKPSPLFPYSRKQRPMGDGDLDHNFNFVDPGDLIVRLTSKIRLARTGYVYF